MRRANAFRGGADSNPARTLAIVALAALVATGCFRVSRSVRDLPAGDWTVRLGDPGNAPYAAERVPARVRTEWSTDLGRGMPVAPIVQNDFLVTAVSGGVIVTANASSGSRYWTRRFNGPIAGQVLRVGTRVYFATQHRNGTLYSIDLERGRRQWSRRIGAPAAAEPAYANGHIYLATNRDVQAVEAGSGRVVWRARIGGAAVQAPIVVDDELLVVVADTLFRLRLDDGAVSARTALPGEPSAPLARRGDTLVIAMHPGIIAAFTEDGAREIWRQTLDAPVLAAPVITENGVFALTRDASLFRMDPHGMHRIIALDRAATESLTVTADGAIIGTLDGRVTFVRGDGTVVWEQQYDASIRAPAAVHDSRIYIGTLEGRLVRLTAE